MWSGTRTNQTFSTVAKEQVKNLGDDQISETEWRTEALLDTGPIFAGGKNVHGIKWRPEKDAGQNPQSFRKKESIYGKNIYIGVWGSQIYKHVVKMAL